MEHSFIVHNLEKDREKYSYQLSKTNSSHELYTKQENSFQTIPYLQGL